MTNKINPLHSFANLPPEIETSLRDELRVRSYQAGESVFGQGAPTDAVYLVAAGRVKVVRVTQEGFESVLCVRGPGDYFCPVPLLDGGDQLGTAVAMTDVTLFCVEREAFQKLCRQSPELLSVVQGDCLSEVRHLLNRMETFAFRSVRERLAFALLHELRHQSGGADSADVVHLTQEELAGMVGASRESVSRMLKELEKDGLVETGRGKVHVLNRARLGQKTGKHGPN